MTDGPYARLYLACVDDEKFETIYADDHHFATWCRLLMIAEPAWPASAHLPATARRASVKALAEAELIDLLPGGRYRIHGLDAERNARAEHARTASNARWNAQGNAPSIPRSNAQIMPRARAETKTEKETNTTETPPEEARDSLDRYYELTQYRPWGQFSGDALHGLERDYGVDHVIAALDATHTAGASRNELLKMTAARLARDAEHAKRAKAAVPRVVKPVVDEKARNEIIRELQGRPA